MLGDNKYYADVNTSKLLTKILSDEYRWIMYFCKTNTISFLTSDQPVVRKAKGDSSYLEPVKRFVHFGDQVFFPLTPNICLCAEAKKINPKFALSRYEEMDYPEIKKTNIYQISQSFCQVFSNKDNFDLAKEIVTKYPKASDPSLHYQDMIGKKR
jgi:hypothetical protein